ncbi:hypothetical protein [Halobacillus campisalis]
MFAQGIMTLLLYMITFTLSLYFLASSLMKQLNTFWMETEPLPFFEISSKLFLFSFIGVIISILALIIVASAMKLNLTIKEIIAQYGAITTPFLALNVLTLLFSLSGTVSVTLLLLGISCFYVLLMVPVLVIYHHGVTGESGAPVFYWSVGTSILILLLSYLFWKWILIERLGELTPLFGIF